MILAAGLTPAWQHILQFETLAWGGVNRAHAAHWCASGKVLNVGLTLHHLGGPARTLALVGGETGQAIRREFDAQGIDARWIESETPTRICTTVIDTSRNQATELVENSAPVPQAEIETFLNAYVQEAADADLVVLSGSLPPGTPVNFYRRLLEQTPGRAILDIRGPELQHALDQRPFLVKPNREELGKTLDRDLSDDDDLLDAMHDVNRRGAEWVVVTQGKRAVWATTVDQAYWIQPLFIDPVNPIGCGDCLAGGIAWALAQDLPPLEAIRLGMAAAAENLRQLLPARIAPQQVEKLAPAIGIVTL